MMAKIKTSASFATQLVISIRAQHAEDHEKGRRRRGLERHWSILRRNPALDPKLLNRPEARISHRDLSCRIKRRNTDAQGLPLSAHAKGEIDAESRTSLVLLGGFFEC